MVYTDSYLSYSGFRTYEICPKKYYFCYILKMLYDRDPRSSMLGSTLGKILEWFYTKRYWASIDPIKECYAAVDFALEWTYKKEKFNSKSDLSFCKILRNQVIEMIPQSIKIIREKQFLTVYSRAEVDLSIVAKHKNYDFSLKLGGRCDFIHGSKPQNIFIVDGKASKWRDKYVDSNQLLWYGIQHYLKYKIIPSQLGFIFWAFPDDSVTWIEFDSRSMRILFDEIFSIYNKICLKIFNPTPSHECKICNYKLKCPEGIEYNSLKRLETGGRIDVEKSDYALERM